MTVAAIGIWCSMAGSKVSRWLKDCIQAVFEEIVRSLSTCEVHVSDNIGRVCSISQEFESHRWVKWESALFKFYLWPTDWRLSAKADKAGISTLENSSVIVVLKIDPLDLSYVALHVSCFLPAIKLITDLVEWLILVHGKENALIYVFHNRIVFSDLVPKNISLVLAI